MPFKLDGLKLDNEYQDDPLLGSIYTDFPILDRAGKRLFITDVINDGYNLLSFSKTRIESPIDLNIISVGKENNLYSDFFDIEGKGLKKYKLDLQYLIRPDGYIVGIFKEFNIHALKKCML